MAGSAGAIRAGRAFVELGVDDSPFARGLRGAAATLRKFGSDIGDIGRSAMMAGAAVLTPLAGAAKLFASMGHDIEEASARTGIGSGALQGLGYAAKLSGVSVEQLEVGLKKMAKTVTDASYGEKAALEPLNRLGLKARELAALSPDKMFLALAQRISEVGDPTQRAAAALDIFGKSGVALLPMMLEGASGISRLIDEAGKLGLILSEQDVRASAEFHDELKVLWESVKVCAFSVGRELAPAIKGVAADIMGVLPAVREWVGQNGFLIVGVAKAAAVAVVLGGGLYVLGKALTAVSAIVRAGAVAWTIYATAKAWATQHPLAALAITGAIIAGIAVSALAVRDALVKAGAAEDALGSARAGQAAAQAARRGQDTAAAQAAIKNVEELRKAEDDLAKARKRAHEQMMTASQKEIEAIRDVTNAQLNAILKIIALETGGHRRPIPAQRRAELAGKWASAVEGEEAGISEVLRSEGNKQNFKLADEAHDRQKAKVDALQKSTGIADDELAGLLLRYREWTAAVNSGRRNESTGHIGNFADYLNAVEKGGLLRKMGKVAMTAMGAFTTLGGAAFQPDQKAVFDKILDANLKIAASTAKIATDIEKVIPEFE